MQEVIKKSHCMWCMNRCSVQVVIQDGRMVKVEENKDHPRAEAIRRTVRACSRARHAPEWFYHPDRLKFPLKRLGDRGEGKWQQIPWEQTLDEIADKLGAIKERYGAEAVGTSSGTGRTFDEYRIRFFNLFGSPNNFGQGHICFGPSNSIAYAVMGYSGLSATVTPETKCCLMLGFNPEQSIRRTWFATLDMKRRGGRLIVVDPRRTKPAETADIWLQIRPGTDAALLMGMINIIIAEGLYDRQFVENRCHGFDKLVERAQEYPLDKVAEITWLPKESIIEAARMYASNKPAVIQQMEGLEHIPNCIEALHARFILAAITGNFGIKGGEKLRGVHTKLRTEYEIQLNEIVSPEQKAKQLGSDRFKLESWPGYDILMENTKVKVGREHICFAHAGMAYEAMITGKPYPIKAVITLSSNPLLTQANSKKVYKALKNLDLYVVVDYWLTSSAEIADYVLPAAGWMERPQLFNFWDTVPYIDVGEEAMPPTVESQYERRNDYDFWRGLGLRLGQEKYWPWQNLEEALNYRLEPLGLTISEAVAKYGSFIAPAKGEGGYEKLEFDTSTGKFEIYSTVLEKLGYDPLPRYYEPVESPVSNPELAKEYPFILITGGRHHPFYHTEHRQIDSLRREHPEPIVQINPNTAAKLGIGDGEWVWIESPRGRVRQKCRCFDGIDPRVIHAQHGWWFPELPGEEPWLHGAWESNINVLTSDDLEQCNPINGGWPLRTLLCKVYKIKTY